MMHLTRVRNVSVAEARMMLGGFFLEPTVLADIDSSIWSPRRNPLGRSAPLFRSSEEDDLYSPLTTPNSPAA